MTLEGKCCYHRQLQFVKGKSFFRSTCAYILSCHKREKILKSEGVCKRESFCRMSKEKNFQLYHFLKSNLWLFWHVRVAAHLDRKKFPTLYFLKSNLWLFWHVRVAAHLDRKKFPTLSFFEVKLVAVLACTR